MQYEVSLPAGWTNTRTWPVVVAIAGSGKDWDQSAAAFAAERDKRRYPFIIVTPIVTTNGGREQRSNPKYGYSSEVWDRVDKDGRCVFDMEGLRAVAQTVAQTFNGESKIFLTGFSGGGQIAIAMTYLHPDALRASAIAASNYSGRCITKPTEVPGDSLPPQQISPSPSRVVLPVRFFNGSEDAISQRLIPQRDQAMQLARENGFDSVSAIIVPGARHEPMVGPALAFFASYLADAGR